MVAPKANGRDQLQMEAAQTVAAHKAVQAAAEGVVDVLDELSISDQFDCPGPTDSIVYVIERAQRSVSG